MNQQVAGASEVFRGVSVENWVALPVERIYFEKHNKIYVKKRQSFIVNVRKRDAMCYILLSAENNVETKK